MTTIKDIARLSGYSIGTVSRVINQHPDVSDEARRKVEEVIKREGYQPNSNAKLLKQRSTSSVTVLVKGRMNIFFGSIIEHVQTELRKSGEEAIVEYIDDFDNEVTAAVQLCIERKPKGLIFLGGNQEYFRKDFGRIDIPCVLLTNDASSLGFDNLSSFCTDDKAGSAEAVDYLMRAGHRRIGIVGGSADEVGEGHVDFERLKGCESVFERYHVPFDAKKQYVPSRFAMADGYEAAMKMFSQFPDVTALFCMSDIIALGAMRAAADSGRKVPDDLSIIGYDGIPYAYYAVPRLSTVQQDAEQIARKGVEDLLIRLNYSRPAQHEIIPFRVLAGETVKPPKKQ
jgi:LacI family transcriptional regulator